MTFNVSGRVCFGIAEFLGVFECIGKGCAGGIHLIQNVVGGAVHNAQHTCDGIACQRIAQGAQNRNRTSDSRLIRKLRTGLIGSSLKLNTVFCQKRFITRNHRFTGL